MRSSSSARSDESTAGMRKRPVQARAERTVSTIFEATAQIMEEEGEASLTTNKIARRAGFSIGTLYQYFPTKEAVLGAMIERERQRALDEMHAALRVVTSGKTDAHALLRERIRALIDTFGVGSGGLRRNLVRLAWRMDRHENLLQAMREIAEHIGVALVQLDDPALRPPTPATLFVLTRAVMGTIRSAALEDSPLLGTAEFEDALVTMAWSVLRREDAPR